MIQQNRNVEFVERQSNRVTVWDVQIDGIVARVVYDKNRQNIITILPPDDGFDGQESED